jgi:hypothetical protein
MKTEIALLESDEIKSIISLKQEALRLQADAAYNLFTLSTYNSHLENFHSDIIASLLSPVGMHGEGAIFLNLFIDYLNNNYDASIDKAWYANAEVIREKGRIDIWIRDMVSRHCIIIENKMNDAGDMDEQLSRYFGYALSQQYTVDATVYLSLDGLKKAPLMDGMQARLLYNVGAFTNQYNDLVSSWLEPCYQSGQNENSRSLIFQYIKQIKHLNYIAMSKDTMQKFYEFISKAEQHAAARTINQLSAEIGTYRRDLFHQKWNNDFAPFKKIHRLIQYGNCGSLFENFLWGEYNFKLDIYFENNGSALVRFWLPDIKHDNERGRDECMRVLREVGMDEGFKIEYPERGNSMVAKTFFFTESSNMIDIDKDVYLFVKELMSKLITLADK